MYPIASLDRMYHPESIALLLELLNNYKNTHL